MANTATVKKARRRIKRPAQILLFLAGLRSTSENPGKEKAIYLSDKANALASHDSTKNPHFQQGLHPSQKGCAAVEAPFHKYSS